MNSLKMESPTTSMLKSNEATLGVDHVLSQLRSRPKMEVRATPSPKSHESTRLQNFLSQLPKLAIPTTLQPLESFNCFPKLPIEIRIKVWKLLATQPRKVKLLFDLPSEIAKKSREIEGQSKIPEVLQICQESRAQSLRFYTLCGDNIAGAGGSGPREWANHVYINFDVDHFCYNPPPFKPGECMYNFEDEILQKVKFIDANMRDASGAFVFFALARCLMIASRLEDFRFVITSDYYQGIWRYRSPPSADVTGDLIIHSWLEEELMDETIIVKSYCRSFRKHHRSSELAERDQKVGIVFRNGLNAEVWNYDLQELDCLSRKEITVHI